MSSARLYESKEDYILAKRDHDAYKDLCLSSDKVSLNVQWGILK